ncbi:MAG: endolytic transglycosylase MltG [Candidatus Dormiibacterota bacterium]
MKKKLAIGVAVLIVLGVVADRGYAWVLYQIDTPVSSASQPVSLTILPGEGQDAIATQLQQKGLIRDRNVFLAYLRYSGQGSRLEAGRVTLNRDMTMRQLVVSMTTSVARTLDVRLQAGMTIPLLAQEAAAQGAGTVQQYQSDAKTLSLWNEPFLQGRPANAPSTLEGFLFPDTYQIYPQGGSQALIARQLARFQQLVGPLQPAMAAATAARPAESLYSVLILASIVEKEEQTEPARSLVCGIFYNRLAAGMNLGSDATVLYALGRQGGGLTAQDLQVDSPYNTRRFAGLPPGPISNPSLDSIKACVTPQASNYLFFFSDPKGVVHYAATDAEFEQQQQQYGVAGQ